MKKISLNGGRTYMSAAEAVRFINTKPRGKMTETDQEKRRLGWWRKIMESMDPDLYQEVDDDLAPCTGEEFLEEYLSRAYKDLVIA